MYATAFFSVNCTPYTLHCTLYSVRAASADRMHWTSNNANPIDGCLSNASLKNQPVPIHEEAHAPVWMMLRTPPATPSLPCPISYPLSTNKHVFYDIKPTHSFIYADEKSFKSSLLLFLWWCEILKIYLFWKNYLHTSKTTSTVHMNTTMFASINNWRFSKCAQIMIIFLCGIILKHINIYSIQIYIVLAGLNVSTQPTPPKTWPNLLTQP